MAAPSIRMDSVTIGARTASGHAPDAPNPASAAKGPAPAVGYPAVGYPMYPPVPHLDQGYLPVTYTAPAAPPPPVPPPATVVQQQASPGTKPFSPFDSMVITDGTGKRLPPCKLANPFFLAGCVVNAAVGVLQMPRKALHGDLNTPPKAWRKLPRFSSCCPQQQIPPAALHQQGVASYTTVQYAPVPKYEPGMPR